MIFSITACNSADSSESSSTTTVVTTAKQPVTPEEYHTAMINKSLVSYGNVSRMQNQIKRAQNGEEVTVAYIGGSITEGLTAGADACYAKLTYQHFAKTYGKGDNVKYVNAGLSGTPSTLGVLRLDRDVLQKKPDIVFIEFAVNDGSDSAYQSSYESMVRMLLESDRNIAVVLLFARTAEGYSAQSYMKQIGSYYSLPMISYADALTYMIDNKQMTWEDFSTMIRHIQMSMDIRSSLKWLIIILIQLLISLLLKRSGQCRL